MTVNIKEEEQANLNPFKQSGNYSDNINGNSETNGREYLKPTETSFSQAVMIYTIKSLCLPIVYSQSPCPISDWEEEDSAATVASFKQYLWSIIYMPASLRYEVVLVPRSTVSISGGFVSQTCFVGVPLSVTVSTSQTL